MGSGGVVKSFRIILKFTFINGWMTDEEESSTWQWVPSLLCAFLAVLGEGRETRISCSASYAVSDAGAPSSSYRWGN